jgi:peroxiredoxin
MAIIGLVLVLGAIVSYLTMIFVLHRFTYKTWIFDTAVGAGMVLGAASWFQGGGDWLSWSVVALGIVWFLVSRIELRLVGSHELTLHVGDRVPAMAFLKTDGTRVTEQDLIANAPALLALYRGWWCPSSRAQLNVIMEQYESLSKRGVSLYAASVDEPEAAAPIQAYVGDRITILCSVSEEVLNRMGVLDERGAPWYDRIRFGAAERPIAMPATLVMDKDGSIIFAARAARVDEGLRVDGVFAALSRLP